MCRMDLIISGVIELPNNRKWINRSVGGPASPEIIFIPRLNEVILTRQFAHSMACDSLLCEDIFRCRMLGISNLDNWKTWSLPVSLYRLCRFRFHGWNECVSAPSDSNSGYVNISSLPSGLYLFLLLHYVSSPLDEQSRLLSFISFLWMAGNMRDLWKMVNK